MGEEFVCRSDMAIYLCVVDRVCCVRGGVKLRGGLDWERRCGLIIWRAGGF